VVIKCSVRLCTVVINHTECYGISQKGRVLCTNIWDRERVRKHRLLGREFGNDSVRHLLMCRGGNTYRKE
jgi:hypothetical protein